jgi:hypothetical protein
MRPRPKAKAIGTTTGCPSIDQCADGEHAQAVAEGEHGESGGNLRPCPAEFRGQRCAEQIEHHRHDIDAEDQRDEAGNDMAP